MDKQGPEFQRLVRLLVPINGLPPQYQEQMIKEAEILRFRKRDYVFRQCSSDNYTYYLLAGTLELMTSDEFIKQIDGGTAEALFPLAQLQPRQMSAKAKTAVTVLRINRVLLDKLLSLGNEPLAQDRQTKGIEVEVIDGCNADWIGTLLQSELFSRVQASNISKLLSTIDLVTHKEGDEVVRQGDAGDYYYLIRQGRAEMLRKTSSGQEFRLAELEAGASFGEEALVSESRRNATVRMLTDGALLRLTRNDIIALIKNPLLKTVTYEQGREMVKNGAVWLDVRFRDEHAEASIAGSLNVPLSALRSQLDELDPKKHYITYCDSGSRSSVAAFLLTERGLKASYLEGGWARNLTPLAAKTAPAARSTNPDPHAMSFPSAAFAPVAATPVAEPVRATTAPDPTEAEVRVSALKAELSKATLQIEEARRLKAEAEAARVAAEKALREKQRAERKKLDKETRKAAEYLAEAKRLKAEIEAQKCAAEQEAEQQRRRQEQHLQQLKAEAEKRLEGEKRRLEELYRTNAEQVERIQAMRAEAETVLVEDRKKLEAEINKKWEEARAQLAKQHEEEKRLREEARRLKAEAEAARVAAEKALREKQRAEREKLDKETRKAAEYLAEAKRLKAEIEAQKCAAEQEAEQQRRRQEQHLQQLKAEAEKRLEGEKRRLEELYRTNAEQVERIQAMRAEAETVLAEDRKKLEAETKQKREEVCAQFARQNEEEKRLREEAEAKLAEDRRKIEAEFVRNAALLELVKREKASAEAARRAAAEEAEAIIAEYRSAHEKQRAQEEARLHEELRKLEEERARLKAAKEELHKAREQAEAAQQRAEEQLARAQQQLRTDPAANQRRAEVQAMEEAASAAAERVRDAVLAQEDLQEEQAANEKLLEQTFSQQGQLRAQLERELAEWLAEQEAQLAVAGDQRARQPRLSQADRIKRKASEARDKEQHDHHLVEELSSALGHTLESKIGPR